MGVPVFNGAFSTFLAVAALGSSQSYVFATFFKQLFLCTVLGVMNGLVVLPVLLSLVAPPPHPPSQAELEAATSQKAVLNPEVSKPATMDLPVIAVVDGL